MGKHVLITGGAGFIGSHVADALIGRGHRVRALDLLVPQVHGTQPQRPEYLNSEVELLVGDIRDAAAVQHALKGIDAVYHFAALVGVGQSMYQVQNYTEVNNAGTAVLLEALIENPLEKLIVASSMSIYGEGLYRDATGEIAQPGERLLPQLRAGRWEVTDEDGQPLAPLPTPEWKTPSLASVYALSKFDQERMCLLLGRAYDIPTVALRLFNVYGPRQALSNPYTGVLAIFSARLLNDRPPLIFEDGLQRRDFVSVHDVARACVLALETNGAVGHALNVGSGENYTVREIAQRVAAVLGKDHIEPEITHKYRVGDIRHCFANVSRAHELLGYAPQVPLDEGLSELAGWLSDVVAEDHADQASGELQVRGLTV